MAASRAAGRGGGAVGNAPAMSSSIAIHRARQEEGRSIAWPYSGICRGVEGWGLVGNPATPSSVRPELVEACPERLPWQAVEGGRSFFAAGKKERCFDKLSTNGVGLARPTGRLSPSRPTPWRRGRVG
jgi:hypothetical protein